MSRRVIFGALGLAALFAGWAVAASRWPPHVLPGPGRVVSTAWEMRAELAGHTLRTARRVLTGYTAAVATGLPLAALMAGTPLDRPLGALFSMLRAIPPFAWAPLLLLWVGIGDGSAATVVFLGAFFPIVRLAREGFGAAPPAVVFAARNLGAPPSVVTARVLLPAAMPLVFSGLRLGWTLAWMSVVAAELVGADGGLGQLVLDARNLARPDVALAGMAVLGSVAALSEGVLHAVEARVLRWRP